MLRIEKISLRGFKSFCDFTEIFFDAEGITAVVGPNGCGKSNVADALSWVIGEQRAKALRGGKMEDVIFQGSRNRKPAGMAEVILSMKVFESFEINPEAKNEDSAEAAQVSNSPQQAEQFVTTRAISPSKISLNFQSGESITVARRLYRTGESEYEMNGRICRLRDVQDLFAGTGLGGAHYAIIEQGRIGQVLSAKPLDRRALIEEAAGISKFKMRQRSAELKLEAARQNLTRITDIVNEVERQQASLKRQAAKSRRYKRLRDELRSMLRFVFAAEYEQTQQTIAEKKQLIERLQDQISNVAQFIAVTEEERKSRVTKINSLSDQLNDQRDILATANLNIEKARQRQSYLTEQINSFNLRADNSAQDQVVMTERQRLLSNELNRLRENLIVIEKEVNTESLSLSVEEAKHQTQSQQDQNYEQELATRQHQLTDIATHRERWKQLVHQFQETLERCEKTIRGLENERLRAEESLNNQQNALSILIQSLSLNKEKYEDAQQSKAEIHSEISNKKQQLTACEQAVKELYQQYTAAEQRLKSLQELDQRRAYFPATIQSLIKASKQNIPRSKFNIIGTLSDFIKVSPDDEVLVEAILHEELQYVVTPTFEDALNAIDFLKYNQFGRATFLVLNSTSIENINEAERKSENCDRGKLIDLLGLNPAIRQIIHKAMPRIAQTRMAPEIEQAIEESINSNGNGFAFLTASGEFISAGHLIAGGSDNEEGLGILALKREIETLTETTYSMTNQISVKEEQATELRNEERELGSKLAEIENQLRMTEKQLAIQQEKQEGHQREIERSITHLSVIQKETQQATLEKADAINKLAHAESELTIAEEQVTTTQLSFSELQSTVATVRRQASERLQVLASRRADFAAKSERRKGLANDIKRLENESQELTRRLSRSSFEAEEAAAQVQILTDDFNVVSSEIEALQERLSHENQLLNEMLAKLSTEKESLAQTEYQLENLREELNQLRDQKAEMDILIARAIANLEHLEINCQSELGESLQTIAAAVTQLEPESDPEPLSVSAVVEPVSDEIAEAEYPPQDDEANTFSFFSIPPDFDLLQAREKVAEIRGKIDSIGPVNLLALDELNELEERYIFMLEQRRDIELAVSDLTSAIAEIKKRSRDKFVIAFNEINKNFTDMFLELFGGGHAEMRLIDESDVLESGIDIIAQPPGKRLQNVLLLSGGEKAMAALALIMGIFKYRPSPFCLLDEVDAPLDDMNIDRFANKIHEMSGKTQFMVITHSKHTMEVAKTLYGVTMEDPGVSKLISVRLS